MIRAPFNFVPLSKDVFFPEWANQISQDIPFSDGVSGTIDLEITAESPIFIRNGHSKKDAEANKGKGNEEYNSFSHIIGPDGKPIYFIPATTIKGEVRTLLEIMSFSKMTVDRSAMFARRDLNDKDNYSLMTKQKEVHCGWLKRNSKSGKKNGDEFIIYDCGTPMRISHPEIDKYLGKEVMRKTFSDKEGINLNKNSKIGNEELDPKTATYKYKLVEGKQLNGLRFSRIGSNSIEQDILAYDINGNIRGTIVFTGQPSKWTEPRNQNAKGKYYEFVFPDRHIDSFQVSQETFDHYKFIYKDSVEWKRISSMIEDENGVPVFFRIDEKEDKKIKDFGMAYLYKMPYDKSVYEALPDIHRKNSPDLAQCIFGYTNSEGISDDFGKSLKGRVQFGNAFTENAKTESPVTLILNSPKASYYPIYIHQEGTNGITKKYATYDNGTPEGWKRYLLREGTWDNNTGSDKLDTTIYPLSKGTRFKSTISFHNLRPIELGALLSALTFHGHQDSSRHSLGQAKPYGYGKCKYNILLHVNGEPDTQDNSTYYMDKFEKAMDKHIGSNWIMAYPIAELFTIASNNVPNTDVFKYMELNKKDESSRSGKTNEFVDAKKKKEFLRPISELPGVSRPQFYVDIKSAINQKEKEAEIEKLKTDFLAKIEHAKTNERPIREISEIRTELTNISLKTTDSLKTNAINELIGECDRLIKELSPGKPQLVPDNLVEFFPKATSYSQFEGRLKKWLEKKDQNLSNEDIEYFSERLKEAYQNDKKHRKDWIIPNGKYFKRCCDSAGEELATEWFNKLNS